MIYFILSGTFDEICSTVLSNKTTLFLYGMGFSFSFLGHKSDSMRKPTLSGISHFEFSASHEINFIFSFPYRFLMVCSFCLIPSTREKT